MSDEKQFADGLIWQEPSNHESYKTNINSYW